MIMSKRLCIIPLIQRFTLKLGGEYIAWLQDITKETNLSYVFLYFYGLERHLLIGKYDEAVDEVLKLLKYHQQDSFRRYASGSLIAASIARNRLDIIQRAPFLLDVDIDEALALKIHEGMSLSSNEVMNLANAVGFMNRRYIKSQPDLFRTELQKLINDFETKPTAATVPLYDSDKPDVVFIKCFCRPHGKIGVVPPCARS